MRNRAIAAAHATATASARACAPGPPAEPQRAWALACVRMDPSVLQRESNDPNQLNEELYIHCALDFATHNYVKLRHITIDIQEN